MKLLRGNAGDEDGWIPPEDVDNHEDEIRQLRILRMATLVVKMQAR